MELPWDQKGVLQAFEKRIFQFFENFWVRKLKPFSWKVRENTQDRLNQNLVIGSFLENGFESTLSSKMSVVSAWKEYFSVFCKFFIEEVETIFWESETKHAKPFKSKFGHRKVLTKWFWSYLELRNECCDRLKRAFFSFFANCWVTKVKQFSGKVRQNVQDCLNQKLGIGSFLENGFERILGAKSSFVSVWKEHFLVFWRFLSDEVETIFWEIERNCSKLFQSKFGHKKLLRKPLWSYLQLKTECWVLEKSILCFFCKFFIEEVETTFWESGAKHSKLFKWKFGHRNVLRKWFWSYLELKNECCDRLKRAFFSFLQTF